MNPPPLPPSVTKKSSFSRQAATNSLLATAGVVILLIAKIVIANTSLHELQIAASAAKILDGLCGLLIIVGFIFGIVGLVNIPLNRPKNILVKCITGLVLNGLFFTIIVSYFAFAHQKSRQSRLAALDRVKSAQADLRSSNRRSFDPKRGITNTDAGKLDRLSSALKDASANLSGDDALISQAMAAHVARLHNALTNYQSAVQRLRAAEVLNHFSPTNKTQFAARREIVEQFLRSNGALTQVITNSENGILADLTKSHVSDAHIKAVMEGYRSSATPINTLTCRIRECDDRMGAAILDALNLLDTEWYKWNVDAKTGRLRFDDNTDLAAYNKALQDIHDAGADQLKLEKQLVHLQQTLQPQ